MMRRLVRSTLAMAAVLAAAGWLGDTSVLAQDPQPVAAGEVFPAEHGVGAGVAGCSCRMCRPWEYGQPDLFYNFYVPNNCGGVPAQLYVAPRPAPPLVGHTYYTYQPLMPHEFMYPHYRTYRHYYDDGRGVTRTRVVWYSNPVTTVLKDVRQAIKIPR